MVRENSGCLGKKVAVIGSGPAGLSCAYFLRRMGYPVTVFEKRDRAGGMVTYAIPEYRLPRKELLRDIDWILGTGIELRTNTEVGKDITMDQLRKQGYQAFFVAVGAQRGMKMGLPGEELPSVMQGLDFLTGRNQGSEANVGKKVAVIGGGDTAIDSARVAFRLGAEVTVVYRRTREEMPAIESEIREAEAEGIRFEFLALPERVQGQNGTIDKLVCRRMKLGDFATEGRRKPEPTDELFEISVDTVIAAIGQIVDTENLAPQIGGIVLRRTGSIAVNSFTYETGAELVYAGGDAVTGPSIVVEAIGAGERAAVAINEKLSRDMAPENRPYPFWRRTIPNDTFFDPGAEPVETPRLRQETLRLDDRRNFNEVEMEIDKDAARCEALRCLRCDYRKSD